MYKVKDYLITSNTSINSVLNAIRGTDYCL